MATKSTLPTVTVVSRSNNDNHVEYMLVGGDIGSAWQKSRRAGEEAWCRIAIWNRGDQLASFGGSVWPGAWPALFESGCGTAQTGPWTRLTGAGLALIEAARLGPYRDPSDRRYLEAGQAGDNTKSCEHCGAEVDASCSPVCAGWQFWIERQHAPTPEPRR